MIIYVCIVLVQLCCVVLCANVVDHEVARVNEHLFHSCSLCETLVHF